MSVPPIYASQIFARKLSAFAGQALLVYDYLLTLPLETAYIWNAPWTLVKALFLINRYGGLFGQIVITLEETGYLSHGSQEFCFGFQLYYSTLSVLTGETIRLLVAMRACAILKCNRSLALFLQMLYILYALGLLVVVHFLMNSVHPRYEYLSETGICFAPIPPNGVSPVSLLWLSKSDVTSASESSVAVLAYTVTSRWLYIVVIVCCNLWRLSRGFHGIHPSRFIRLLARDALLFYFAALFNVSFSIISWTINGQNPKQFIQTLITNPLLSIVGQRVILNLREFRLRPHSTRDLSREVDRQIAAMHDEPFWEGPSDGTFQMVGTFFAREGQITPEQSFQ